MDKLKLEASYRSDMSKGHAKQIRRDGFVTANIFGHGSESIAVEVKLQDLLDQIKQADAGVKSLIDLKIKGAPVKADGTVIVKDFLKDPLTRRVLDIQFQRVSMKEKIHVGVPVEMVGEAPGVKGGGMLEQVLDELQISCLPSDIPLRIEVDINNLELGGLIRVEDLAVADGVDVLTDSETLVVSCRPPHIAAEPEPEEAAAESVEAAPAEGESL
jgi:large subunit ribosomal protein L25